MYQKMQLNAHVLLLFVQWAGSSRNILHKMFPIHLRNIKFDSKVEKIKPNKITFGCR